MTLDQTVSSHSWGQKATQAALGLFAGLALYTMSAADMQAQTTPQATPTTRRHAVAKGPGIVTPSIVSADTIDPNYSFQGAFEVGDNVLMDVIKTADYKWNTRVEVFQRACNLVDVIGRNEDAGPEVCPPNGDASHILKTGMYVKNNGNPDITWQRVDNQSTLVGAWDDIDRISLYFRGSDPMNAGLNNLKEDDPNFHVKKMQNYTQGVAASVGINPGDFKDLTRYPPNLDYEVSQMENWLTIDAEPDGVMLVVPKGIGTDNHGLYEIRAYLRDGRTGHIKDPILVGELDYGTGRLHRTFADPSKGYAKIWAGINTRGSSGIVEREFGIDTQGQTDSTLYINGLEQLQWRK